MSSKDLAARAAAVSTRRDQKDAPAAATPNVRTKPVRLSLDISPNAYRSLIDYCLEIADEVGKVRVPHSRVLRVLIDRLNDDDQLRKDITEAVTTELRK